MTDTQATAKAEKYDFILCFTRFTLPLSMLSICLLMHAYFSNFYDEIDYLYKQQIKMNKILTALVIAATLFVASSCSSENGEDPITPDNHQEQKKQTSTVDDSLNETWKEINKVLPSYAQIRTIEFMPEDFERTPKKSIKRYLYQRKS